MNQLLNSIGVFADKIKKDSSGLNSIYWEKIEDNNSKPLKNIIWKSTIMMKLILKMKMKKVQKQIY